MTETDYIWVRQITLVREATDTLRKMLVSGLHLRLEQTQVTELEHLKVMQTLGRWEQRLEEVLANSTQEIED